MGRRYTLLDALGRGSNGEVWRAHDRITGDHVAVKLLNPDGDAPVAQTRREIASLRAVQLPGVVRLLDEGREGGRGYLVMELVRGTPFPGIELPAAWRDIAELTRSLLEILARVHAAGVVHQDIKPGNVLVHEGHPTLLDFGVAWGGLYDEVNGGDRAGTPAYMAPEQVERGVLSSATDLYALGTMLYEALSGRLPFESDGPYKLMLARCCYAPIPLGSCDVDAPATVVQLVDAMIQRDPSKRPRDAREAIERLAGQTPCARSIAPCADTPWSLDELRAMIVGADRIFHVPEDAAAVLWSRTRGERERVRSEVESWVRVGFARRDGERIVLDRSAVDRLIQPESLVSPAEIGTEAHALAWAHAATAETLRPGTTGRLAHLTRALATGRPGALAEVLHEAVASARRSLSDGHTGRGLAALADAWLTANRVGEPVPQELLRKLFAVWSELSLVDGTPAAIDRTLHELARASYVVPVADLETLLQAAVVIHRSSDRAFEEASALPTFAEPALERWRHAVRVQATRLGPIEREEAIVESLRAWAASTGHPQDQAAFASWEAWSLYRRGLYVEAAERHLASVALDPLAASRLSSMLAAASALLEGFHPERALDLAAAARSTAAESRLTYLEARACWIERAALYRLDRTTTPDIALVESVRAVGVGGLYAMVALTEAAVAWRGGDARTAHDLAMAACREWSAAGRRWAPDMARSLALACGGEALPGEVARLASEALACPVPMAGLQVLALLAAGQHPTPGVTEADVARIAGDATVPLRDVARLEVIDEPVVINREALARRLVVQTNVRGRDLGGFAEEAQRAVRRSVRLPPGYRLEWGGQFENLERAKLRLAIVVPLALGLILALLYMSFRSVGATLLIFANVPFAATGGIVALWSRGLPLSLSAGVGFIALFGVAVLNGLVLVTQIRQLREQGSGLVAASREGALRRLRPVLTTALVASLGFVPMAITSGAGSEVQRPLATVVIGGLVSSTLLTLLVLPTLYAWLGRVLGPKPRG